MNSNLPLSRRRGGERAAEAGRGLHGWAPRPRRARGRGRARSRGAGATEGARGAAPPAGRVTVSVCGWGFARARAGRGRRGGGRGVLRRGASAPAHRLRGLRSAWDPRWPAPSSEPVQSASDRGQRTLTNTKGGCGPAATRGCPRYRRGSRPSPGHTGAPRADPRATGLELLLRGEWGKGEPAGIPELLLRSAFGHRERSSPPIKNSSVTLPG